ncbi:MAG TPA: CRISPR-associated protein Csx15 [Gemmata sp.]|nr:CRISPR-associated protein Csx15 [Gemmata sp.]
MILINFSHPITSDQNEAIAVLAGQAVERVIDVPTQFDHSHSFSEQAAALVNNIGLSAVEWGTTAVVVNLPAFAPGAGAVLAELHGRTGHFPSIIRLRPVSGANPPRYEPAELIDLQTVRDAARTRRF